MDLIELTTATDDSDSPNSSVGGLPSSLDPQTLLAGLLDSDFDKPVVLDDKEADMDTSMPFSPSDERKKATVGNPARALPIVSLACAFCHKRKIKCDGKQPCVNCFRRGQECVYQQSQRRGPKPKSAPQELASAAQATPMDSLQQQIKALRIEVEVEKRLTEHWKSQYFEAAAQISKCLTPKPDGSPAKALPQFSQPTLKFLANPQAAVDACISAFAGSVELIMPTYKIKFAKDALSATWPPLVQTLPADISKTLSNATLVNIGGLFEHCLVFLLGSHVSGQFELAEHFHLIVKNLVTLLFLDLEAQRYTDLAQQLVYCMMMFAYYYKVRGKFAACQTALSYVRQLIEQHEASVTDHELVYLVYTHFLHCSNSTHDRDHWVNKILALPSSAVSIQNKVMFNFSWLMSEIRAVAATQPATALEKYLPTIDESIRLLQHASTADLGPILQASQAELSEFYSFWFETVRIDLLERLSRLDESRDRLMELLANFFALPNVALKLFLVGVLRYCAAWLYPVGCPSALWALLTVLQHLAPTDDDLLKLVSLTQLPDNAINAITLLLDAMPRTQLDLTTLFAPFVRAFTTRLGISLASLTSRSTDESSPSSPVSAATSPGSW